MICVFACAAIAQVSAQTYTPLLDLTVHNATSQARTAEPVTFGIPIPIDLGAYSPTGYGIIDSLGQAVPCQWKPLARWGGDRNDPTKPIRWVQVTFPATVAANSVAPYYVAAGAPNAAPPATAVTVTNGLLSIDVHTTPTTWFRISKLALSMFDTAVVNGVTVTGAPGRVDAAMVGGLPVFAVPTSTVIEESPGASGVRAVIAQKGLLGLLRYTCRWQFAAGRSDVVVEFRLENPAAYGLFDTAVPDGQQYLDRLYVVQPFAASSTSVVSTLAARTLSSHGSYDLRQDFTTGVTQPNMLAGFNFAERVNGVSTPVGSGGRYAGALDVGGTSSGITVAVDRFWQNFPKSLRAGANELQIGLFPEWGHGPEFRGQYATPTSAVPIDPLALTNFRFEGGRWKTHRMLFDFHASGPRTSSQVQGVADRANAPLMGRTSGAWIRNTNALGILWGERQATTTRPTLARLERFYDIMVDDNAADVVQQGNQPHTGLPGFINTGGTPAWQQNFGWENWGDLTWADGYCSLHYDWPLSMLLGFYRTGDYRFYDKGRDMAAYRRDMGQNHSTNILEWWRGAQFYEKGWWHGNDDSGQESHTWLGGLLVHYAMTGDEASREAALECAAFCMRFPPGAWSGYWGSRIPGWSIDLLVDAYNFLGDPAYLVAAGQGVARIEQLDLAAGGHGYLLDPGNSPPTDKPWMDNILFIGMAKYVLASGDHTHDALLVRMRDFFRNTAIIPATGPANASVLAHVWYEWAPSGFGNTPSLHLNWAMAEALSYASVVLNAPADLTLAGTMFDTACNWWQVSPNTPVNTLNSATWSPVTMRPIAYPNSETKTLGNILLWSSAYMWARNTADLVY